MFSMGRSLTIYICIFYRFLNIFNLSPTMEDKTKTAEVSQQNEAVTKLNQKELLKQNVKQKYQDATNYIKGLIKKRYNPNDRTQYRGIIHKMAFLIACGLTLFSFVFMLRNNYINWYIVLYCLVQMMQFGFSALYHTYLGSAEIKAFYRNLDHMAIFFLISGTQTSCVQMLPKRFEGVYTGSFLKCTWIITAIGSLRIFLLKNLDVYCIIDLVLYCAQGLCILLFRQIFFAFYTFDLFMLILGGVFYLAGAVIYGLEKPNPIPHVFGFHEIFHIFTLLGNGCYGIVIYKSYINELSINKDMK